MFRQVGWARFALALELLPEQLFGGAWLTRQRREGKQKRISDAAGPDFVYGDGLVFAAALKNHGVQILQAARQFRLAAQGVV